MAATDPDREYRLIEQLEFRIAAAQDDDKLETIIRKFLPALILKLGSEIPKNRNAAIKVCQYVNQRLKINSKIQLPVQALLKTFREADNAFVRRFSLMFIEQGLPRQSPDEAVESLPAILKSSIPSSTTHDTGDQRMWATAFDFLLDLLQRWRLPESGSKDEIAMTEQFQLSDSQADVLSKHLAGFLLYDGRNDSSMVSLRNEDLKAVFDKYLSRRSTLALPIAKFLFTPLFTDPQRLLPATVLSIDSNAAASSVADTMFKQRSFDLESDEAVNALFDCYKVAKPKLQIKILSLLSRSQRSTLRTNDVMIMVESQLNRNSTGLEASKLRSALFTYLTWMVRMSPDLGGVRVKIQNVSREYVEQQGWPTMTDRLTGEIELRAKAYETIGLLASAKDQSSNANTQSTTDMSLVTWLFTSLRCDTTKDIRGSIEEALGRVMNYVSVTDQQSQQALKDLLMWNVKAELGDEDPVYFFPTTNLTKYPAVRFANKSLQFSDVDARLVDLIAIGTSSHREVIEEGLRGLDPYWHQANLKIVQGPVSSDMMRLPDFDNLTHLLFNDEGVLAKENSSSTKTVAAAVVFCRNVWAADALQASGKDMTVEIDWKQRIDALVANDLPSRKSLKEHLQSKSSSKSIHLLLRAALIGLGWGSADSADIAVELTSLAPAAILTTLIEIGLEMCAKVNTSTSVQERAARVFGVLASLKPRCEVLLESELQMFRSYEKGVGEDLVKARGHLLRAGFGITTALLRGTLDLSTGLVQSLFGLLSDVLTTSRDKSVRDAAALITGRSALCVSADMEIDIRSGDIGENLLSDAKKENEVATAALGRLVNQLTIRQDSDRVEKLLEQMYALHEIKKPEFHFALGEALSVASAGYHGASTMTDFDVDATLPSWGLNESLMIDVLDRLIENLKKTKPSLRKASAIWLLCLVQYCGDFTPVKERLRECQAAFGRMLNDRDELAQETGSRGLSLVYERGDKSLRDDLIRDLVQSFTNTSSNMSGTVDEDTQLFEAGTLPTERGESVTTYKDIVSLATEMGDPSLVYRFMNLASSNAIWTSRAAFGRFGLGNVLADSSYLTENKKIYPKLFRYRFDPNPNVQRSMNEIWRALVKDSNAVIDENFDGIMQDLLKSIVFGKDWRAREASCAAISDLIQGREVEKFEKYLDEIWNVAFKVLDDVKETVRIAAMKLCQTLTNMLIRNLEVGEGSSTRAAVMLNHAMPFLLQQMEGGAGKEVQANAVMTLLKVVKKCPSRQLRPFAPTVLETLVNSLSGLEHESINYLHLNADKYSLTAEKLDKMRVSSINASPVTEAIDSCLESVTMKVDTEGAKSDSMEGVEFTAKSNSKLPPTPMQDAMQRLEKSFKTAIGLPSRVGLSRVIVTLVVKHSTAFRPFADRFARLNRKYVIDRNATISIAFSMSLAYLMRICSEKEVRQTNVYAQKLYFESQEASHRQLAAEIVLALSKGANDTFLNYASTFLPFTFVGRHDTDEQTQERFEEAWKDNTAGSRALSLYLQEICSLVDVHIKSTMWPIRHACCFAVADLVSGMDIQSNYSDRDARMIWPLVEEALGGKTWEGKERVVTAFPKFVKNAQVLWTDDRIGNQLRVIAIREAKRANVHYRPHAVQALGEFAAVRKDLDLTDDTLELLTNILDETGSGDSDKMDLDAKSNGDNTRVQSRSIVETTTEAVVSCLFQVIATHADVRQLETAVSIVRRVQAMKSPTMDRALYDGAISLLKSSTESVDAESRRGGNRSETDLTTKNHSNLTQDNKPEGFIQLSLAVLDQTFDHHDSQPESVRKSRVSMAGVLGKLLWGTASSKLDQLKTMCSKWLETERSRSLREDIVKIGNQPVD